MNRGIPISGAGCLCAAGPNLEAALDALLEGRRQPAPPRRFRTSHPFAYPVFELQDLEEPADILRTSFLGLLAARGALEDAGIKPGDLTPTRVGVIMGTTIGCALSDEEFCRAHRGGVTLAPTALRRILDSNPASIIAQAFGFEGPRQTVVNACSSSTDAIGIGAAWIREGRCDAVLAGGADELSRMTANGFISMKITDAAPCRPFDRHRRGLNLGEGAAVLVLESEATLRSRGIPARAHLLGYGSACDAHHQTAPHPEGTGLRKAIKVALAESGLSPNELAFVNAHGTGTPENDLVESRVLAQELPVVPYLSTKGGTGHTLGAAGAIEAAFTIACLERGEIPPSLGLVEPAPELGPPPVTRRTPVQGRAALSQSLAFGGSNAVVILGRGERRCFR